MTNFRPLSFVVILPVRNEAAGLPATLSSLQKQTLGPPRVLVVDGGSQDGTIEIARDLGAETIESTARGRGYQIAAGIAASSEDVIVIAHGDMRFSVCSLEKIGIELASQPYCPGGCLGHQFDSDRRIYRVIEWFDNRRALGGISYGDQAQFVRRACLDAIGGFPALPIMEDLELSLRMSRIGKPVYLNCPVTVSPRRFEQHGIIRVLWQNWRFRRAYRSGGIAATQAIFQRYYTPREERR